MSDFLTCLSRRVHLLFWRITGKTDSYVKIQVASSHNTRENQTVQDNIKTALDKFYSLVKDKESKILDAGCGDGWTMDQLSNQGYSDLWGIDINEDKLKKAKEHGQKKVEKMLLPEVDFETDFFDVIFCRHVYEHLLYPQKTLKTFYRILRPGGVLFLIAPKSELTSDANESHTIEIGSPEDIAKLMETVNFIEISKEEHFLEELEFWVIGRK